MRIESDGHSQGNPRLYELIENAPKTGKSPTVWAWPELIDYLKIAGQPVPGPWPPHQERRPDPEEESLPVAVADPEARRGAKAREAGTTVLVVGARPGEAFEVSPWEESWRESGEAMELYREQRYAEAAAVLRDAIERYPNSSGLYYNLACFESMAGENAVTVTGHLARAIELHPTFRDYAVQDSDFEPVADDPAFKALVEEQA